ncbi:hypothetical protein C8Q77DRAFT_1225918 [Trametes polyzona]|nr:hypothetical protein C8Q77DRAFT_1225918 [Trametes polyzona]
MPRDSSPPELSPSDRTALWVQAQAGQTYDHSRPPSPARASIQTSSSYRTTATSSSEEGYFRSPVAPAITSHAMPPATSQTQRPKYDSRSRRASMPFPQSPPGSGYPVPLEVASPRREASESSKQVSRGKPLSRPERCPSEATVQTAPPSRPSLRKQRRPSLIDQIISLGMPSQRRREESGRRGQT